MNAIVAGKCTEYCVLSFLFTWLSSLFGWSCGSCGRKAVVATSYDDELSVTSCSVDSVEVKGNLVNDLIPGTYLIATGDGTLCVDCAPLFRKVTAVADGPTAGTKTLTTEFATFAEIFDVTLYSESLADETIEPAFNCPHSSARVRSLMHENPKSSRSLQLASCGSWLSKNQDGRCTYTDCFVGTDGSADDCFSCKTSCDNGCGPEGGLSISGNFGLFDFGDACCSHDHCYSSSTFSKEDCDDSFYLKMIEACPFQNQLAKFILLPIHPALFTFSGSCESTALLFYSLVKHGGEDAYNDAQEKQKQYELEPVCVAKCPSTQRSGGQGTTRLVIDLKKTSGTFPVFYEMYDIPDELTIVYDGSTIFSTGGQVSGSQNVDVSYAGTGTYIEVTINAPNDGTIWDVEIGCPFEP
jgi:hypothetical protein